MHLLPPCIMTLDDFRNLCYERRSIRYFSDKKSVDKATLESLIDIAHLSPSVENTQPWHFHIITNNELRTKLMECSCYGNFVAGAGTFIVVTCDRSAKGKATAPIWNPKEMEYSCAGAMHSLMLAAESIGIGTCWVSLHHGPSHNLLRLKDHEVVVGGIMLGYLKEGEKTASGEHDRHPLKEIMTFHE